MSKQRGRDIVRCRQKQLKVVTRFNDRILKERAKNDMKCESQQNAAKVPGIVPFEKLTGRGNVEVDAQGIYILGKEQDDVAGEAKALVLDPADAYLRPRVPSAVISEPTEEDERFPMTKKIAKEREQLSVLEPKYDLLDRLDVLRGASNQEDHDTCHQLVLPSEFTILDKLKFHAISAFADFNKMQGRPTDRNPAQRDTATLEPQYKLKQARVSAPVNMAKMFSRGDVIRDKDKDQVLCKLRANHDEIEKAMRLLTRFPDVEPTHARSFAEVASSPRNLNVLSSKPRVNQTLVDMSKSIGRRWEYQNPVASNQDTHLQSMNVHKSLILNVQDGFLSTRRRSIGFVNMKTQLPRPNFDHTATATAATILAFMDPTRDSATARFLAGK